MVAFFCRKLSPKIPAAEAIHFLVPKWEEKKKESALLDLHKMFTWNLDPSSLLSLATERHLGSLSLTQMFWYRTKWKVWEDKSLYPSTEREKGNPNGLEWIVSLVKGDNQENPNAVLEKLDRNFSSGLDHSHTYLITKIFPNFSPAMLSVLDLPSKPPTNPPL